MAKVGPPKPRFATRPSAAAPRSTGPAALRTAPIAQEALISSRRSEASRSPALSSSVRLRVSTVGCARGVAPLHVK